MKLNSVLALLYSHYLVFMLKNEHISMKHKSRVFKTIIITI